MLKSLVTTMNRKKWKKTIRPKIEGVELTGSQSEWDKLPGRIRTLVKNSGLARLSKIRNQITTDAGLPMPEIYVVPYCWTADNIGPIFGLVRPTPYQECVESYVFSVFITAATLIVIKDDMILRRIVCHEFAHCFWYISLILRETKFGNSKGQISLTGPDSMEKHIERDSQHLVNPKYWFGQWDTEHFTFGEDEILHEPTKKIMTTWINSGLPVETPNLRFKINGCLNIEDEIVEHARNLEEKGSITWRERHTSSSKTNIL